MTGSYFRKRDEALTSEDLDVCQAVLDAVKDGFELDEEELSRTAAIVIELYRQGVHDAEQLKTLTFAARGIVI